MAQLEIKAAEMYLGSRGLFEGESKFCTISCKMRRKADAHHGEMVEIVSCAPLSCPMEIASSSLWRELTTLRTFPDKTYRYMQASSPNVMEKCFDQILRSNAAATPLNGLQVMKKFEEADRVVLPRTRPRTLCKLGTPRPRTPRTQNNSAAERGYTILLLHSDKSAQDLIVWAALDQGRAFLGLGSASATGKLSLTSPPVL
ncbi:hypothetical protein PF006_g21972 [Phytophthora fragariae]|uniref:Uncharacterized protein n=1 Tax=Phytophthora fragariae TaxID=53985 RepID=A0A6A3E977_9STRA|nr:hypothetical protein PF009_g20993 [Phytophthora fragariae]KAE9104196.1 hypothetical protein PF006_g21972 [Phytophthora fragariae]